MRRAGCLILALFLVFGCLALPAAAVDTAQVSFKAGTPDASGYVTVTMSMQVAAFNAAQFAVRYDPAVLQPVTASGGAAQDFWDFATLEAKWLATIGCSADPKTGFIGFTGYVSPGTTDACITDGEALLPEATVLFSFRFKVLSDGDPKMKIATGAQGEPYEHAFPQGAGVMGRAGESLVSVTFDLSTLAGGDVTQSTVSKTEESTPTVEQLLQRCLILKINSHAAVAEGGVTAFYPGERDVVPFIDGTNRTFVPLRFIAERLGAKVEWVNATKTVVITKGETTVRMSIGSTDYTVNGVAKTMDTAPQLMASAPGEARTMVPIRFVAEALGCAVGWNNTYRFVLIDPAGADWDESGETEQAVAEQANTLLLLYSSFV